MTHHDQLALLTVEVNVLHEVIAQQKIEIDRLRCENDEISKDADRQYDLVRSRDFRIADAEQRIAESEANNGRLLAALQAISGANSLPYALEIAWAALAKQEPET